MRQEAPDPQILFDLVAMVKYRPGWFVEIGDVDRDQGSIGLTLSITTKGLDTYHPEYGETYRVRHMFIVPAAAYNMQSWMAWLRDCFEAVEIHECNEFFQIDQERPFAPHHGPGEDPYQTFIHGTDEARRTNFRGELDDPESGERLATVERLLLEGMESTGTSNLIYKKAQAALVEVRSLLGVEA